MNDFGFSHFFVVEEVNAVFFFLGGGEGEDIES